LPYFVEGFIGLTVNLFLAPAYSSGPFTSTHGLALNNLIHLAESFVLSRAPFVSTSGVTFVFQFSNAAAKAVDQAAVEIFLGLTGLATERGGVLS
jgi:hypothetical protein